MNFPLLSIIIPTYNRALIISDTINSILLQSYKNWECIIVDDGSTDNTQEIVASFSKINPSIHYFKRPNHLAKGPSSCRNYGFSKSSGTIINWFDSDDIYMPNAFQSIVNHYTSDFDVVVAKLEIVDLLTNTKIKENTIHSNAIIEDYFTGKIAYYVCGPFWNRLFLEKQESLFDENIRNLDDWDFNMRMILQNPISNYINEPLIQYRSHQNSLSQEIHKFNFEEITSEINARTKIVKLIKDSDDVNQSILNNFFEKRCGLFLREALIQKHPKKYYLLVKTVNLQLKNFNFFSSVKTFFGFTVYVIFKKGYKLIKP